MRCPFCNTDSTQVTDTRENDEGDIIRRRRRCNECDKRFTTFERIELKMPQIVKRNTSRSEYDREKLHSSMKLALRKRPVTAENVEHALDRIESHLLALGEREVRSDKIGELVMRELKRLDKIAYIRFASVYRNFEDAEEFSEVIRELNSPARAVKATKPTKATKASTAK